MNTMVVGCTPIAGSVEAQRARYSRRFSPSCWEATSVEFSDTVSKQGVSAGGPGSSRAFDDWIRRVT